MSNASGDQEGGAKDVGALLFRSGVVDTPPDGARERTLAALGLGPGGAPVAASLTDSWAPKWIKWTVGGGLSGLLLFGGLQLATNPVRNDGGSEVRAQPASFDKVVDDPQTPAAVALVVAPDQPRLEKAVASDNAKSAASPKGSPDSIDAETLAEELRMLDAARQHLHAQDGASALRKLDEYKRRFPRGRLAPEIVVLRTEALIAVGDRPAAERVAAAFLKAHPKSPYASRLNSLLASEQGAR